MKEGLHLIGESSGPSRAGAFRVPSTRSVAHDDPATDRQAASVVDSHTEVVPPQSEPGPFVRQERVTHFG
jgi:hypothetical protein